MYLYILLEQSVCFWLLGAQMKWKIGGLKQVIEMSATVSTQIKSIYTFVLQFDIFCIPCFKQSSVSPGSHSAQLSSQTPARLWHDLHATSSTEVNASHIKVVQEPFSKLEQWKPLLLEQFHCTKWGMACHATCALNFGAQTAVKT